MNDFVNYMTDPMNPLSSTEKPVEDTWEGIEGGENVYQLTESTFDSFIEEKKQVLVMFYKPSECF